MADLGKAYVQIVPSAQGIKSSITKELSGVGGSAGKSAGIAIAGKLKAAIAAAGIGAAIVGTIKAALTEGGNLEQSFGGLETIYGEAADAAKEYAWTAAQAGISANDYAEQAVSFGASLRQAFGGDTVKAAEAANTAIMDMADNSAKMGTDIGSIQAAYQGFAKQNYTMLDNLKLGYGGTKTEMERLLADAEKITGVKYDVNNLGDVYDAIHVIQGELGLTGVAAEEAKSTLTGSANATRAAWKNVLAALSTGEGLEESMENLSASFGNLAGNVLRMVGNIATQLPAFFRAAWTSLAPVMAELGGKIMTTLRNAIANKLASLDGVLNGIGERFNAWFISAATSFWNWGKNIIAQLVQGIVSNVAELVNTAKETVTNFVNGIKAGVASIVAAGRAIIDNLVSGIKARIAAAKAAATSVINNVKSAFNIGGWSSIGSNIISGIISGITGAAGSLFKTLTNLAKDALERAKNILGIGSPSKLFKQEVGRWIPAGIAVGIEDNLDPVYTAMDKAMQATMVDMDRATAQGNTAPASMENLSRAINALAARPINVNTAVSLTGDAGKLFKVVRQKNETFTKATNYNALAMAGV